MAPRSAAHVSVAGSTPTIAIRPEIFGSFIEHFHRLIYGGIYAPGSPLSDARGFRLDVAEALAELAVPVVRWPGGCFVSAYDWRDGVGPERRPTFDKAWRVDEPNTFGTAEFVAWCRLVGTTPYICTNAGTGTAEQMADWLEYCNAEGAGHGAELRRAHGHPEAFAVPYWSIGNENYGSWELGAKDPSEWARLVKESAKMMRRVDPTIRLITAARADLDWTLPLLRAAGPFLDAVAIHGYWDELSLVDEPSDYLTCVGRSLEPERDIGTMRAILETAGYDSSISIAFDEWNLRGWHHPAGNGKAEIAARDRNDRHETYTMADAVFSASFLHGCIRNADIVSMANVAPLVNGRGPLYADERGIVRRTTFHTLAMYARHLTGARYAESVASSASLDCGAGRVVPVVDAVTARRPDGDLVIALVNRHPSETTVCHIEIDGRPLTGPVALEALTSDSPDAFNSPEHPDRVLPETRTEVADDGALALAPHSITFATAPGAGGTAAHDHDWVRMPGRRWAQQAAMATRSAADAEGR